MLIYKLKFTAPVRFGLDNSNSGLAQSNLVCQADTLFAALCQTWLDIYGAGGLAELLAAAERGDFRLSSAFPYSGEELFLPKPYYLPPLTEHPRKAAPEIASATKKQLKELRFIAVSRWREYLAYLRGEAEFTLTQPRFAVPQHVFHVRVPRKETEAALPYLTVAWRFAAGAGLYFIADIAPEFEDALETALQVLGSEGLGGKRSSGYGKFELAEEVIKPPLYPADELLLEMLQDENAVYQMALAPLAPQAADWECFVPEASFYALLRRSGFVASPDYSRTQRKRLAVHLFAPGSCLNARLKGSILNLAASGNHPVYRYGKGLFMGVRP